MARFSFRLPDIGEGISEAEIVAWHVAVGDRVEEDGRLADMMTDKATVEMESPVAGTVVELAGEPGDQIAIGSTLVVIETAEEVVQPAEPERVEAENPGVEEVQNPPRDGEGDHAQHGGGGVPLDATPVSAPQPVPQEATPLHHPAAPDGPPPRERGGVLASPAVRARAADLGIDLSAVHHDGPHIRHADLDAYLRYGSAQGYRAPNASRARPDETVKVIGMRRRIAENMAAAKRHIPHFTYVEEIDVTALEAMRADLNAARGNRPKLTMLPLLIVAICRTLPDFPMLNARYDDEAGVVTRFGSVHLGMAAQTDAGLMVPVIRDAQDMNPWQLATEIVRLAEAARTGKAKSEELSGGTITITSLGPLGGIATTPVINRPEVAIIGPNRIVERPVFRARAGGGEEIVKAKLMNLSISCDHRVVDGHDAASYVQALKRLIETPVLLFAD
ncbi:MULTISPECIES: dihydrolipoamide acetyltransferase family protein [unclassified Sphingomonas]|uniref:dihydrolipoamide acetyltransferase family protein n=1 Tax=unclassified Sphingomonas TaxID=196159 RepID=UPI0006FFE069|nr:MULTISPECIES: dihydrolipoamide acetyltransferase family protein [unclassified Sphingomonas]KQM28169.1 branched-chain alpha-keto acid dehydrogenase subunit E2 [Sphingomonas sp. Leaf9]KQM44511.1 branched-chain alpha-keto acid dehydrogenase subunit E2 [Sphingomonas sp. Leaf11]